jgi:hypothetical protein
MNATAGTGALLSDGKEIPVTYDLVEPSRRGRIKVEGQAFGDTEALGAAYHAGPCVLRLTSRRPVRAYLLDRRSSNGAADIRVTGQMRWA